MLGVVNIDTVMQEKFQTHLTIKYKVSIKAPWQEY